MVRSSGVCVCETAGDSREDAHRCDLVGLGAVFQQQGHDVGVALLGRLVERGVAHLDPGTGTRVTTR